jgi:hypothetical protein
MFKLFSKIKIFLGQKKRFRPMEDGFGTKLSSFGNGVTRDGASRQAKNRIRNFAEASPTG